MRRITGIILLVGVISCGLVSCKPTEKGYREAYDAAIKKREAAAAKAEYNENVAVEKLQQEDGPLSRTINGQEVYIINLRLKALDKTPGTLEKYNVAVGCFSMPTNCVSLAEDLRKEGVGAIGASGSDNKYYTIVASVNTLDEAVEYYSQYDKANSRAYLGLPGAPVIIVSY